MNKHYVSKTTGEVVDSIRDVIRTIIGDFRAYHIINVIWKRLK